MQNYKSDTGTLYRFTEQKNWKGSNYWCCDEFSVVNKRWLQTSIVERSFIWGIMVYSNYIEN
jgi:hypothetical protein